MVCDQLIDTSHTEQQECTVRPCILKDRDMLQYVSEVHNEQRDTRARRAFWESGSELTPAVGLLFWLTLYAHCEKIINEL